MFHKTRFELPLITLGIIAQVILRKSASRARLRDLLPFPKRALRATGTFTVSGDSTSFGNAIIDTVGKGLQVKEGSNAKQGTFTLTSGTVTVANTSVTSTSRIYLTGGALNSSTAIGELDVTSQTAGTGFTITSYVPGGTTTQTGDLRTVAYEIFEPAP